MSNITVNSSFTRRLIVSGGIALLALALIISYFAVFRPMAQTDKQSSSDEITVLPGEVKGAGSTIYMYEYMASANISKISVENGHGSYTLTRLSAESFCLDEDEDATYDAYMFANLVVATGATVTNTRVVPEHGASAYPDSIDLNNYGLDEQSLSARYTVTSNDGKSYTVRIGFKVSNGEGYYACVEGRNAVYILANDLESTVLGTVESIVTPSVVYPMSSSDYHTADYFTLWHGGEHFISIHYVATKAEADKYAAISNYLMTHGQDVSAYDVASAITDKKLDALLGIDLLPYTYTPAIDEYAGVLEMLVTVQGTETVAIKEKGADSISLEQLWAYGIDPEKPAHELFYTYQGVDNYVIFSELHKDGYYYAYSAMYDIIVKVSADDFGFLEWGFNLWVEPAFFQKNINNISEMAVKTDLIDHTYTLESVKQEDGTTSLTVRGNGTLLDTANFRQFYKVALTRKFRGAHTGETPGEDSLWMTLRITTTAGVTTEYKFYRASTQNLYMTINGEGEFYALHSTMKKLESDSVKVMAGEAVEAYDRN